MALADQINSLIESIKKFWAEFDIKTWTQGIGGSSGEAVETAIYFGLSFAVGFFLKRYGKLLLFALVVSVLVIKGLEHFNFLTLDWEAIKAAFSITPAGEGPAAGKNIVTLAVEWVKAHLIVSVASVVGFLIGYKVA